MLGDIINSSPTWVGPPSAPYPATWTDALHSTGDPLTENSGGATKYAVFASSASGGFQTRTNVVYAGANDGFLHGFRSGSYDSGNNYVKANNDGTEVLAFMPRHIARTIHQPSGGPPAVYNSVVDFSDPQYGHKYDVDAPPGTGDLFYSNTWHTWLVGGLGAGGQAGTHGLDDRSRQYLLGEQCRERRQGRVDQLFDYLRQRDRRTAFRLFPEFGLYLRPTANPPLSQRQLGCGIRQWLRQHVRRCRYFCDARGPEQRVRDLFVDYLSTGRAGSNGIAYVTLKQGPISMETTPSTTCTPATCWVMCGGSI